MRKTIFVKKKFLVLTSIIIILIVFVLGRSFIGGMNTRTSDESKDKTALVENDPTLKIRCTRKVRLENEPQYDRALSIIGERYSGWDDDYLKGKDSFSFFPSQLVNCIKVIESDLKDTTGAEGQFIFNSSEIQDNYFPITVDMNYSYTDDYINALLLIHEITHVEQYIKSLNKTGEQLSCIDNEVEAFYAEWSLPSILGNEAWKAIHYRIDYDKDLNAQLKIIKTISDNYNPADVPCGANDSIKCIDDFQKNVIKKILLQDNFYKKQCNL